MRFFLGIVMIVALFSLQLASASYRKPPFNGSIFGKRGMVVDSDPTVRALSALCEIASETCQAWYQTMESK